MRGSTLAAMAARPRMTSSRLRLRLPGRCGILRAKRRAVLRLLNAEIEHGRHLLLVECGLRRLVEAAVEVGDVELDAVPLGGRRQQCELGLGARLHGRRDGASDNK